MASTKASNTSVSDSPAQEVAQVESAPNSPDANAAQARETLAPDIYQYWYEQMMLMRRFEEKAGQLYGQQKIRGFCHLYIGQEAVVAGMLTAMGKDDKVITAYRDHAHALGMGITPNEVMAELYGKSTGCSKGKGGSMHMFSAQHNFFGGHGIVGAQIPLGAGIAFAEKYRGTQNIAICFMGDGAVRQGALHEAFTMAMLWKLPVVFICENNMYGMGTSVERTTNVPDLYRMGAAYDMPSFQVNGMECEEVHYAISEARKRALEGTPTFLEIKTYRYKGHSMSDPAKYRTREELDGYKERDPIERLKAQMLDMGIGDEAYFEGVDNQVKQSVDESVQFAEESPWPDPSEIYKDVYKQADYPFLMD